MNAAAGAQRALTVGLAVLVGGLLALTAWQYLTPIEFTSALGLNPAGVAHFRRGFGIAAAAVETGRYRLLFWLLLLLAWMGYLVVVAASLAGARLGQRVVAGVIAGVGLLVALAWPLSLSEDVYGYVGYARLVVAHHANPYLADSGRLLAAGEPTAPRIQLSLASPYGPLWTLISMAVVGVTGALSLLAQLIAMKLVAAAALLATARLGHDLAERIEPGRGPVAALALGLNPLLVIEGPGNGHNDLAMMALVLAALLAYARARPHRAALLVGCAAAIKYAPLALLPWIAAGAARREVGWGRRARRAAAVGAVGLLPLAVSFAPFWRGLATFGGIGERLVLGQSTPTASTTIAAGLLAVAVYAALSVWVLAGPDVLRLLVGWIGLSIVLLVTVGGFAFPWYLAWPVVAALTVWRGPARIANLLLLVAGVAVLLQYSIAPR